MIHSFTRMQCTVYLRHIRAWIYDVLFGKGAVYIITLCTHMFQGSTPWTSTWDAVYGYEHHALSKQSYWTTAETQHPDRCFTQLETQVTWESDWITVEIKVYRPYAYICSESWCWYHILIFYWYSNIIVFLQNMCWVSFSLCLFLVSSIIRPVDFLRQHQGTTSCSFTDLAENTSYVAVVQEKIWQHSLYGYRHCIQYRYTLQHT